MDHVDNNFQSVIPKVPKSPFYTLECILKELTILKLIYKNPSIKQKKLVTETRKSLSTVKRIMESLQKKDYSQNAALRSKTVFRSFQSGISMAKKL